MSLVALALRIAATRMLAGATLAEDRLFDSAIDPLAEALRTEPKPLIVVSTEQDESEKTGRDLLAGSGTLTLMLEFAVAGAGVADDGAAAVFVPTSDADLEIALDVMRRQAMRALMIGGGAWGDVFRGICVGYHKVTSRRGAGDDKGVRFAARVVLLECDTLAEPAFGAPLDPPWAAFVAQLRSDPETEGLGDFVAEAIAGDVTPEWRRAADLLGISFEVATGIGIAPVVGPEAPALATEGDFGGDITVTGPDLGS
jgi:hypothetical protein